MEPIGYVVDALRTFGGHRQSGNWSTRDGTEVLYRSSKLLNLQAIGWIRKARIRKS